MQKFGGLETRKIESCPVCICNNNSLFVHRSDGVSLLKCRQCGTLYVNEYPIAIDRLYEQNYFGVSDHTEPVGIGYESGYTPIHEQLWQVGLTLIAADILKIPCDNILDIGCATGQFLSLCRVYGSTELHGIDLSATAIAIADKKGFVVSNDDIAQYQSVQKYQIATAWDVIEHLPDPQKFADKVTFLLREDGIFCFSTPNGDVPTTSILVAENWKGFQHSFEHIFYATKIGIKKIFDQKLDDIFLYPVKTYGYDFTLGIASKKIVNDRQRELLNCLFYRSDLLLLAAKNGELSASGISGLICLYIMCGKISDAGKLLEILSSISLKLPSGIFELLQGSFLSSLGRVDEAENQYHIVLKTPLTSEIGVSAYTALIQSYRQDKEQYITSLLQKIDLLTEDLDILLAKFQAYKDDKEMYISALKNQSRLRNKIINKVKFKLKFINQIIIKLLPLSVRRFWQNLSDESVRLRATPTIVYAADDQLFADYPKRVDTKVTKKLISPIGVTLISTVLNEEDSILSWLKSIAAQTHSPDEVIIVDAGSTDRTKSIIADFAITSPLNIKSIVSPGATIAQGRNFAVRLATNSIIACTDLGCDIDPHWLEKLIEPFEISPDTDVVAGWTKATATTTFQKSLAFLSTPIDYSQVDPINYVPSSRTIAFTKHAWEQVGGYPEWATFAAEDSFFGLMLKNQCMNWAFVPEAIVNWHMRTNWQEVYKQAYLYGFGDGELAIYLQNYKRDLKFLVILGGLPLVGLPASILVSLVWWWAGVIIGGASLGLLIIVVKRTTNKFMHTLSSLEGSTPELTTLMLCVILIARVHGFIKGTIARPATLKRRFANTNGTAIIFSGIPIDDSGGGQRATQLALELLDRGYRVIFLNQYPSYETIDLKLSIKHQNLETKPIDLFDPISFFKTHNQEQPLIAIAEFPHPNFIKPMLLLQSRGTKLIYDSIDDWRSSLGGDWYTIETEQKFIESCNLLVASAQNLQERLATESGKEVLLVPNAVNQRIFKQDKYPLPADLIQGELTLIYIGALWGEWFDWDLLLLVAKSYPQAKIVVIGDYNEQCPEDLPNLHFLGLKAQSELPAYLTYADVALIPFKISELTQAVSPLKVFEYLAMGVPVVSTALIEVSTMPYVYVASSHQEFIEKVTVAVTTPVDTDKIKNFIDLNNWNQRVGSILDRIYSNSN